MYHSVFFQPEIKNDIDSKLILQSRGIYILMFVFKEQINCEN